MTTLAAALPINQVTIAVTDGEVGAPFFAQIGSEYVEVVGASSSQYSLIRGVLGSGKSAHNSGSTVQRLVVVAQTDQPVNPAIDTAVLGDSASLPTPDEKDAMDGAAAPDSSNVFATIADVPVITVPGIAIAAVAGTTPAGGTGATAGAYDTSVHRDALIATVAEIKAQLNTLLAELRTAGIIAT